jgi:hypothetical protein
VSIFVGCATRLGNVAQCTAERMCCNATFVSSRSFTQVHNEIHLRNILNSQNFIVSDASNFKLNTELTTLISVEYPLNFRNVNSFSHSAFNYFKPSPVVCSNSELSYKLWILLDTWQHSLARVSAHSKASTYTGQHTTEKYGQTSITHVGYKTMIPVFKWRRPGDPNLFVW